MYLALSEKKRFNASYMARETKEKLVSVAKRRKTCNRCQARNKS